MKGKKERLRKGLIVLEAFGVGMFYMAMLAFFLYPVVQSAGYMG